MHPIVLWKLVEKDCRKHTFITDTFSLIFRMSFFTFFGGRHGFSGFYPTSSVEVYYNTSSVEVSNRRQTPAVNSILIVVHICDLRCVRYLPKIGILYGHFGFLKQLILTAAI